MKVCIVLSSIRHVLEYSSIGYIYAEVIYMDIYTYTYIHIHTHTHTHTHTLLNTISINSRVIDNFILTVHTCRLSCIYIPGIYLPNT